MLNDILYITAGLVSLTLILFVSRLGKEWLISMIGINLILITVFGAKLVAIFRLSTNVGNVFYASIFFCTYLILENYGRDEAYQTLWIGFACIVMFRVMSQLVLPMVSLSDTKSADEAMQVLFQGSRVPLGSMLAYLIAGHFNIWLYDLVKTATKGKLLWLRALLAILTAQAVDSVIFFVIVFFQAVPNHLLLIVLIGGYVVKVALGLVSIPYLYLSGMLRKK